MSKKEKYGKDIMFVKHKRKTFSKSEREFIFERDNYICQKCGRNLFSYPKERVLDHIIPLFQYGSNRLSNIQLLCNRCDKEKSSNITPDAVRLRLEELNNKIYGSKSR